MKETTEELQVEGYLIEWEYLYRKLNNFIKRLKEEKDIDETAIDISGIQTLADTLNVRAVALITYTLL